MNKVSISLFYASWCPHSKAIMPNWKEFKSSMDKVVVNETFFVQCEEFNPDNNNIRDDVTGFPTVLLIWNGKTHDISNEIRTCNTLPDYKWFNTLINTHCI